jgi:hypothetical protein
MANTLAGIFTSSIELKEESPHSYNRFFGGRNRENQPFITGYFQVLLRPPAKFVKDRYNGKDNIIQTWFHSTAESFTPPGYSPILAEIPAINGNSSSFLAGVELTHSFTIAFREYQQLPILSMINDWVSYGFNPNYGMSGLDKFVPNNYKGDCIVIITTPQINTKESTSGIGEDEFIKTEYIEKVFYFDGVFPEAVPFDSLNSDITAHDGLQISCTFRFDGWPVITKGDSSFGKKAREILNKTVAKNSKTSYWDIDGDKSQMMVAKIS